MVKKISRAFFKLCANLAFHAGLSGDQRAAYDEGVEAEHQMLVSALKRQLDKSPVPAIFLLKTRHGYREGDQTEQGNRVSVTFNLPGAQPLDAFRRGAVIEHEPSERSDGCRDDA